jgi:hypothetical protein
MVYDLFQGECCMKRIVVIGDLHFGALKSKFGIWSVYTKLPLHYIMEFCKDKKISEVVLTGDIFDTHSPPQKHIVSLSRFFQEYPAVNFHLYLGNHDIYDKSTHSLHTIAHFFKDSNVFVYTKPTMRTIHGKKIMFLPWPHKTTKKDAYITFAHIPVQGAKLPNGKELKDAPVAKRSYWIIGDLHNYQKGKNWIFPGALHQHKTNDDIQRFFLEVILDKKPKVLTHKLPIDYMIKSITLKRPDFSFLADKKTYWMVKVIDPSIVLPHSERILDVSVPVKELHNDKPIKIRPTIKVTKTLLSRVREVDDKVKPYKILIRKALKDVKPATNTRNYV